MRPIVPTLFLALLLTAGPAVAATSASFSATNTHCYTYGPAEPVTYPLTGFVDLPVIDCSISGSATVSIASCDATACYVRATGTFGGTWGPVPTYGLVQAALTRDYYNGTTICSYATGSPEAGILPNNGGSCTGTSAALPVYVAPGACAPVYISTGTQIYVFTMNPAGQAYLVLTYTWSRIDVEFQLCRPASGPGIAHVRTYLY